jgi:hypothetical protein
MDLKMKNSYKQNNMDNIVNSNRANVKKHLINCLKSY